MLPASSDWLVVCVQRKWRPFRDRRGREMWTMKARMTRTMKTTSPAAAVVLFLSVSSPQNRTSLCRLRSHQNPTFQPIYPPPHPPILESVPHVTQHPVLTSCQHKGVTPEPPPIGPDSVCQVVPCISSWRDSNTFNTDGYHGYHTQTKNELRLNP